MIKDFLIINCTGKNNSLGLNVNNKSFIEKFQNNISSNSQLVNNIIKFITKYKVKLNNNFSVIINLGPGSYSALRISLSVAKGIKIVHRTKLYGYKNSHLSELKLENIKILIKNKQLENKMLKPIYQK